ncbi:1,5-anhydro-D-fructose reductase-like [Ctenocephalides felis]|uniref:1,5-anhydro-D-fructose reductase-like n=1 Tax=Ctenocephalides felis TaxID=7515 RepID=UPI000E6E2621|nr:1,5-anhydro-D-fructose reductase-like [Ctenocephalides felis]
MACQIFKTLKGSGAQMPVLGFGTWQAPENEVELAVSKALDVGYRHIDCAPVYLNEKAVGRAITAWIENGGSREELFIVTKLPPFAMRPDLLEKTFKKSLEDLCLDYVDMYLLHTPFGLLPPGPDGDGAPQLDLETDHLALWKEMERMVDEGLTKSIGVSNYNEKQLSRIIDNARIQPSNLQIEIHVYLQQKPLVEFCKKNDIAVTAYSPLGSRGIATLLANAGVDKEVPDLMSNPVVVDIAEKHSKTSAQILLRWLIQRGLIAIPKSTNEDRLKQNIDIFDFELDPIDEADLNALDRGIRVCDFSFFKGVQNHPEFPW